jgi:hypothetical protein
MAINRTSPKLAKLPDLETVLVAWLIQDKTVTDVLGERIFDAVTPTQTTPFAMLARIGGGEFGDDATTDEAVLRFTTYGKDRKEAFDAISALRASLVSTIDKVVVPGVKVQGVRVDSVVAQPDPVSHFPRYLMTVVVWAGLV